MEFAQQHVEFGTLDFIEHLKEFVDPKMVKKLFKYLCIAFAIRNRCALDIIFNCCDVYKFFFNKVPNLV